MADSKISALTADTTPTSDDLVVTVNDPAGTPANRKVTVADFAKAVGSLLGLAKATASGPSTLDLFEDTDNGSNKITVTAPAALTADCTLTLPDATGTVALRSDDQIWIPAEAFSATAGAVAMGTVGGGRYRAQLFDAASQETAQSTVELPTHFASVSVALYWTNVGAGSGNVVWSVQLDRAGDGETLAATGGGGSSGNTTVAAPAQDVLKVSTLITSQAADESKLMGIRVTRVAADAADTLGNDAALLGVRLLPS